LPKSSSNFLFIQFFNDERFTFGRWRRVGSHCFIRRRKQSFTEKTQED
jgi:hypothetical protein